MDARTIAQGRLFKSSQDKSKHKVSYLQELLTTLVDQRWITQAGGLYAVNQGGQGTVDQVVDSGVDQLLTRSQQSQQTNTQGFQPSVDRDVDQDVDFVDYLLTPSQQGQRHTGQRFQPLVDQNVDFFPKKNGSNGNGQHPLDISEDQLAQLLGGDPHGN
jgi:hypothetical protein